MFATKSNIGQKLPAALVAMATAIEQADEDRAPEATVRKYRAAAAALGAPLDRRAQPYQGGKAVLTLRDDIIHVEPAVGRDAMGGPGTDRGWCAI